MQPFLKSCLLFSLGLALAASLPGQVRPDAKPQAKKLRVVIFGAHPDDPESVCGGLIALPIWLKEQPILGNLAGSTAIFGAAIALIMREHVELVSLAQACLDRGFVCWPVPSAFSPRQAEVV